MSIEKVMEILSTFEVQTVRDIKRDHGIGVDPYESVGRRILIKNIRKRIKQELSTNDDKEAA